MSLADEAGAGGAGRVEVDRLDVAARPPGRPPRVVADRGDLRVGEDDARRCASRRREARCVERPRMLSAAIRAWYLPAWVSSARPLTSPMAYSQSWPGRGSRSSTSTSCARARGRPCRGRDQSVCGWRPIATSRCSPVNVRAVLQVDGDPASAPARAADRGRLDAEADVDAGALQARLDLLAGDRLLARDQPVERLDHASPAVPNAAPRLRHLDADHAAAEDDQALRAGLAVVISRFVQAAASASPGSAGSARRCRRRSTTASPRDEHVVADDARGARRRAGRRRGTARSPCPRATAAGPSRRGRGSPRRAGRARPARRARR